MKKLIIWLKIFESKDLSALLTLLELVPASCQNQQAEEQVVNHLEAREERKWAQLESYLRADDNQGIVNLALYL